MSTAIKLKEEKVKTISYFFPALNIYGLNQIEDFILAGLVTADSVLFVGSPGCAKTLLANTLAETLNLNFIAYDASKNLFEDILGFPNPQKMTQGIVDYIATPISIWDKQFVLIDEISRANPGMQSKWLEIIRSRNVMGKKIENLQYIFSAMNPPGLLGTIPLDTALAGRFAFIIPFPELKDMQYDEVKNIIVGLHSDDAPGIKRQHKESKIQDLVLTNQNLVLSKKYISSNKKYTQLNDNNLEYNTNSEFSGNGSKNKSNLKEFVEQARGIYATIETQYKEQISNYLIILLNNAKIKKISVDGRRMGMFYRNLNAVLSVKALRKGKFNFEKEDLDLAFLQTLKFSLPYLVTGENTTEQHLNILHLETFTATLNRGKLFEPSAEILTENNPVSLVEKYLQIYHLIEDDNLTHNQVISQIEEILNTEEDINKFTEAFCAFYLLFCHCQQINIKNNKVLNRVLNLWSSIVNSADELFEINYDQNKKWSEVTETVSPFNPKDKTEVFSFYLATFFAVRKNDNYLSPFKFYTKIKEMQKQIYCKLCDFLKKEASNVN